MDISIYFESWQPEPFGDSPFNEELGKFVSFNDKSGFPDLDEKFDIAVFGVKEDRLSRGNKGCANAPDEVRKYLYHLSKAGYNIKIADLGNIKAGDSTDDTFFAVSSTVSTLLKKNILPVIIGGGQELTYAAYMAYEKLEQTVNIVTVDSKLDLGEADDELSSRSYLGKIILHQPNYLFNYCNVAMQTHFADGKTLELMEKLFFDNFRLGEIRADIQDAEPYIRNADLFSFDISSIRFADAPGNKNATPNGLFGEEACQLSRYAGMSDKVTSAGFFELNPLKDKEGQTAHLVAQMIWYFIDGFYNRKKDIPAGDKSTYTKFRVAAAENPDQEIIFWKSPKSDRWWMEVPYPHDKRLKFERHHLVPCRYKDYQEATNGNLPDLWWRTFQKLS
ncbi:MAG: formimidoylglutamase [Bacteroidota bacterium]